MSVFMIPKAGWSLPIPGLNLSLTEKKELLFAGQRLWSLLDQSRRMVSGLSFRTHLLLPASSRRHDEGASHYPGFRNLANGKRHFGTSGKEHTFSKYIFRTYFMDAPLLSRTRYIARRFPSAGCLQTTHTGADLKKAETGKTRHG